jgi:hypothetical protein
MKTESSNSGHLTANEISQWLVEGPEPAMGQHLQTCGTCQAKLTEAQAPLNAFRSGLVGWSEAQAAPPLPRQTSDARSKSPWGRRLWLPAASFTVAALLLVGYARIPAFLHGNASGQPPVATASTADSDEALLNQVDTEVSEAVPDAMAPLTDLVSWDSSEGSAASTTTTEKHAAKKTSTRPLIAKTPVGVTN